MNYDLLKAEVLGDPLPRGYDTMTDVQVSDSLNAVDRSIPRQSMSASEVFNAIDMTALNTLSDVDKEKVWGVLGLGELNPFGNEAAQMSSVFGAGSATITALKALRVESVSRAVELNMLGASAEVGPAHIAIARAS